MGLERHVIGYGRGERSFLLDSHRLLGVLSANGAEAGRTGEDAVRYALAHPIGSPDIGALVRPGETVAIVTSDITRPCPSAILLPPLLEALEAAGIPADRITIVFGLGSHRRHTEEEKRRLVGDSVYGRIRLLDSDPGDCVQVGTTRGGTPARFFRPVVEADRRILLGNIEMHYFAGYSGGAKALMPGISDRDAIQANHGRMIHPDARAGLLEGNPVRLDLEEAAAMLGADFILNVVLDEDLRIVHAVAGDMTEAHRAGCAFLDRMYKIRIPRRAELVIASPGGYPKDINLYQAQKSLDNARHAVADGGIVILAAACPEGLGERVFEAWLREARTPGDLVDRIRREFRLGGHKAAAIALVMERARCLLVSDMPDELAALTFMTPVPDLQEAVDRALSGLPDDAGVLVMPHAGSTLPITQDSE